MTDLPDQGSLAETSLPRVLVDLHRRRFGGALELSRERTTRRFLFSAGGPVCSESNLTSDSLAAQLADAGQIPGTERARIEARAKETGAPEARIVLELRLLDTVQVFEALREQVRLRLLDCFSWPDGAFAIDAEAEVPGDAAALRIETLPLVQDGIAGRWSPERVLKDLGPRMNAYPQRSDQLPRLVERLPDDDEVAVLVEHLDGRHTLWQALQAAPGPRSMATAWLLDAVGVLQFADDAAAAEAPAEAPEIELVVVDRQRKSQGGEKTRLQRGPSADESRKAETLRKEVEETYGRLGELDHYQLLGLEPSDDAAAVKRAYLFAAKSYHPDVLARSGLEPEAREQANRVFAAIGKAYATLSDPKQRQEYDRSLGGDEAAVDAERLANAETLFRKGEVLLRLGNFAGALEFLAPAVELWPDEADYQNALGWALYKKIPSEPERAQEHLERAFELSPQDSVILFRLSVVLRTLGDNDTSEALLAQARQLDPQVA